MSVKRYIPGDGVSHVAGMTDINEEGITYLPDDVLYVLATDYDAAVVRIAALEAALRKIAYGDYEAEDRLDGEYTAIVALARAALEPSKTDAQ